MVAFLGPVQLRRGRTALKRGSGRAGAHASVRVRCRLTKGSSHSSCQPTYRRPLAFVYGRALRLARISPRSSSSSHQSDRTLSRRLICGHIADRGTKNVCGSHATRLA
jgi:hypothetical protein